MPAKMTDDAALAIARRHFGVETLQARGLDRLDFHEVSVVAIAAALREAFELGAVAGAKQVYGAP